MAGENSTQGLGAGIGGALTGIIGIIMQRQAQKRQEALERENLAFQKKNAGDQLKLAKSGRTDAYGNEVRYNDLTGEWETNLTDRQRGIVRAGENEQYQTLTTDAMRNRALREVQAKRSQGANEDYGKARLDMNYGGPPSEGAIRDDITGLLANARRTKRQSTMAPLARSAIRSGQTGNFDEAIRAADSADGETSGDDALKARQAALAEFQSRTSAHNADAGGRMQRDAAVTDDMGGSQPLFSNINSEVNGDQSQMMQSIMAALQNGGSAIGGALGRVGQVAGQSPDLGGIGSGLGGIIDAIMGGKDGTDPSAALKPIVYNPRRGEEIYWPVPPGGSPGGGRRTSPGTLF